MVVSLKGTPFFKGVAVQLNRVKQSKHLGWEEDIRFSV